jgi:hypothetical protein
MRHPPDGAVAQLGERVVRNDEVRGSIPLSSTNGGIQAFVFARQNGMLHPSRFLLACLSGIAFS